MDTKIFQYQPGADPRSSFLSFSPFLLFPCIPLSRLCGWRSGMDPAESHLPFFPLGFIFFRASKQNSGHGHVALGTGCFGLMELPLNHQISSLLLDLPTCLYPQGEPGYVLGGVEVIPGRNGQPGPPVSIKSQVWGSLQLPKAWQSSHIPPSPAFPCCRDRRGSRGFLGFRVLQVLQGHQGSPSR